MKATRETTIRFELTEPEATALLRALSTAAPDSDIVDHFHSLLMRIVPHEAAHPERGWPSSVDLPTPRGLVADLRDVEGS